MFCLDFAAHHTNKNKSDKETDNIITPFSKATELQRNLIPTYIRSDKVTLESSVVFRMDD